MTTEPRDIAALSDKLEREIEGLDAAYRVLTLTLDRAAPFVADFLAIRREHDEINTSRAAEEAWEAKYPGYRRLFERLFAIADELKARAESPTFTALS